MSRAEPVDEEAAEHSADGTAGEDQAPGLSAAEVLARDERSEHEVHADADVSEREAEEAGGQPAVPARLLPAL